MESILNEPLPSDSLPPGVVDYIDKLKSFLVQQQQHIEDLNAKNERLKHKFQNIQDYNEDLLEQIKSLSEKVQSNNQRTLESGNHDLKTDITTANSSVVGPTGAVNPDSEVDPVAIVKDICEAANDCVRDQFLKEMVYEETSGLYFDYKTGYYFDAQRSLYYDGNSGTYYQYNYETKSYEVHSQIATTEESKRNTKKKKSSKTKKSALPETPNQEDGLLESDKALPDDETFSKQGKSSEPNEDSNSEPEEGEVESTEESSSDESTEETDNKNVQISSQAIFTIPCIRIIVKGGESVQIGKLFIVTSTGGTIGRLGDHDVLLTEEEKCSKMHAKIEFVNSHYYVKDVGSSNGTTVNGHRLSILNQASEMKEIGHGSVIKIGSTELLCHVHPGRETCFECEPGLVQSKFNKPTEILKTGGEKLRRKEMRAMKKKYGLSSGMTSEKADTNYTDRAKKRRKDLGSDNPYEKTDAAHIEKSIQSSNKGFKMLSKMGWAEGSGLGKKSDGRVEPVPIAPKNDKLGLGDDRPIVEISRKAKYRNEIWSKVQERYAQVKDTPDTNASGLLYDPDDLQ